MTVVRVEFWTESFYESPTQRGIRIVFDATTANEASLIDATFAENVSSVMTISLGNLINS